MANQILTKINQLSKREKNIVGILIVVLSSLPFFYTTFPSWNQFLDTTKQISNNKTKLSEMEKQIQKLEKIKKENLELIKNVESQKKFLAKTYEIDFLVQDLKRICDESSVSLESFTPSDPQPVNIVLEEQLKSSLTGQSDSNSRARQILDKLQGQDLPIDLYRYPIEVKVSGDFTDILELFKKLEKYGRVISVDNISIGKGGKKGSSDSRFSRTKTKKEDDTGILYGGFDLVAYSLPVEAEKILYSDLKKSLKNTGFTYSRKRSK